MPELPDILLYIRALEIFDSDLAAFASAPTRENHTLKRALTDPRILNGIGNAYSDEILHTARLSPMKLTQSLGDEEIRRLYDATRGTLERWIGTPAARAGCELGRLLSDRALSRLLREDWPRTLEELEKRRG